MSNDNNEQPNPEAGAVRASMRITLEIKFAEKGVMMCVNSNDDDIEANGNDAAYVLRKMIAEQIGKASADIIKNVCKSARFFCLGSPRHSRTGIQGEDCRACRIGRY